MITARGGHASQILEAQDQALSEADTAIQVPEGRFNFYEPGETWTAIPRHPSISIFGAPPLKDIYGQVIQWKTSLVMPFDVPGTWSTKKWWFKTTGTGNPYQNPRLSDIEFIGYRSLNPSSVTVHGLDNILNVMDFRIDHCNLESLEYGVNTFGNTCNGLIDHSRLVNKYGKVGSTLDECTVFYGVQTGRAYGDVWEPDISKVMGKYTPYTLVIEDCYVEKWRHCVAANSGGHYVFRHNILKNDFGYGSLDAHGWGQMSGGVITQVGTRAVEIYNNQILNAIQSPWATFIRGGAGVAFNNTFGGGTYTSLIYFTNEAQPEVSKCWVNDWWVWNNTLLNGNEITKYDPSNNIIEGINYFRHAPHTFNYQPYPYPHPRTLIPRKHTLSIDSNIVGVPFSVRQVA